MKRLLTLLITLIGSFSVSAALGAPMTKTHKEALLHTQHLLLLFPAGVAILTVILIIVTRKKKPDDRDGKK